MNSKMISILAFAAGAAVGSVATWKLVKTKYERIAQEEIDSVKEVFSRKAAREQEIEQTEEEKVAEREVYHETIASAGYSYHPDIKKEEEVEESGPYVIPPEQYGEEPGYSEQSLTYYADGVLADDWYEVVNPEDTVGKDALKHFGEYEEDSVYVRNPDQMIEYEILLDTRRYRDIRMLVPHPEDE